MLRTIDRVVIDTNRAWDRLPGLAQFALLLIFAMPMIMLPTIIAISKTAGLFAIGWTALLIVLRLYGHLRPKRA